MATLDIRELEGTAKYQEVQKLLKTLEDDLQIKELSSTEKAHTLLKLRHYGTKPQDADPIYTKEGIDILAKYGVNGETVEVRRAALRCIANACLLNPSMRQVFVDTGFAGSLAERLKCESSEDEIIIARILFLATYDTNLDFDLLIRKHTLGDNINWQTARHAKQVAKNGKRFLGSQDELALTDILKLIFNISKIYPDLADTFTPSIPPLLKVINKMDVPVKPLDGLLGYIINALSTMDLTDNSKKLDIEFFPKFSQNVHSDKLINILDQATSVYPPEELDTRAVPLIQLLINMHEIAPDGAKKYIQWLLLPDDEDRSKPIGKSDTLSSKLLRLSTQPSTHLKTAISELMFVLSGKNAESLTKNIGYGFAAGFLASRGMEIPQNAGEAFATNIPDNSEYNPITGQRWDAEPQDTGPPMTQEEKEREAERLFVLFERARLNGLITAENPVTTALREGRFEELPDDDEESD